VIDEELTENRSNLNRVLGDFSALWNGRREERKRGFEEETLILEENDKTMMMRKKEWDFGEERVYLYFDLCLARKCE